MFDNAQQLKTAIRDLEPEEFFDNHLLGADSKHFTDEKTAYLCERFSADFAVEVPVDTVVIVGSAKLGFALHEKRKPGYTLKAFRPFSASSDIDLTICSAPLFRKIWHELSAHACVQNSMPWNPNKLGDYLMYGWLRPDKFPKGQALAYCDRFYETVGSIRRDRKRGHPGVSIALYYSLEQLRRYQVRSVKICKGKLETEL